MIIYKNPETGAAVYADVGHRGAAVLARLGYISESALRREADKAARRARLDQLHAEKERQREDRDAELAAMLE